MFIGFSLLAAYNATKFSKFHEDLVFRSRGFHFWGFKLELSLVATSLEGFSVTSHEKKGARGPF